LISRIAAATLAAMATDPVQAILADPRFKGSPLTWELDGTEYDDVRHAWLTHVSAEEKLFQPYSEAEWQAQMATMLSVFTDDCVMEVASAGQSWTGHDGADRFYREFIPSFKNMTWVPQALVIGPQGVLDVVNMTGTLVRDFAGMTASDELLHLQWVIFFAWVPEQRKFRGEKVFSIRPLTGAEL
jgi:hypothetical protein